MKSVLLTLSVLGVAMVAALPASFSFDGGADFNLNGTEQSYNFSGGSSGDLPDFGSLLPNLSSPNFGIPSLANFSLPSVIQNFGGAIPSPSNFNLSSIIPNYGGAIPWLSSLPSSIPNFAGAIPSLANFSLPSSIPNFAGAIPSLSNASLPSVIPSFSPSVVNFSVPVIVPSFGGSSIPFLGNGGQGGFPFFG
uniref:Uncharacterized protein n=1 Tax=Anopheles dirus TaxID=7168 RepID=A0A1Y9H2P2_9DIPT